MKTFILVLATFIVAPSTSVFAQDDDTIRYEHGLPITGEDSVQVPQRTVPSTDSLEPIAPSSAPEKLVNTLDRNSLFNGWRGQTLVHDHDSGLYWLHIRDGNTIRSYAFREDGHPMSVMERDVSNK